MRRFLVRFSESEASNHTPSLADFTTTTPEFKFSVHTGASMGVPEIRAGRQNRLQAVGPVTAENIDTVPRAEIDRRWYGPSRPSALFGGQILVWPHELQPVPNVNKSFCQAIDQAVIMIRRWCDPQPLQPSRHCRIVNRLNVDAMIRQ
jgi:hypothetical protein